MKEMNKYIYCLNMILCISKVRWPIVDDFRLKFYTVFSLKD